MAVFTLDYSPRCSACVHLHCMTLFLGVRGSSNDRPPS